MNACDQCTSALPINACPASISIGTLIDEQAAVVLRFTDQATGRVTNAPVDPDALPVIIASILPAFAPGNTVMVEVLALLDDGAIGSPILFAPWQQVDGELLQAGPVWCLLFTPVKTFDADGSLITGGDATLIVHGA